MFKRSQRARECDKYGCTNTAVNHYVITTPTGDHMHVYRCETHLITDRAMALIKEESIAVGDYELRRVDL